MSSTNKTTNLKLSQFIADDKPTWLSDYNGDMVKIDAGFSELKTNVEEGSTEIEALSTELTTVSAKADEASEKATESGTKANEALIIANNANTQAGDAKTDAHFALEHMGNLQNLETEDKTSLVNAINEVIESGGGSAVDEIARAEIGTMSELQTSDKTSLVGAINEVLAGGGGEELEVEKIADITDFLYPNSSGQYGNYDSNHPISVSKIYKYGKIYSLKFALETTWYAGVEYSSKNIGNIMAKISGNIFNLKANKDVGIKLALNTGNTVSVGRFYIMFDGENTLFCFYKGTMSQNTQLSCVYENDILFMFDPNDQEIVSLLSINNDLMETNEQLANTIDDMGAKLMMLMTTTNKLVEANKDSMSTMDYNSLKVAMKTLETM